MKLAALIGVLSLALSVVHGCTPQPISDGIETPPQRGLGIGFETVTLDTKELELLATHIDAAGIDTLYIAVGRIDWTAFPWPSHPEAWSQSVADTNIDYVDRTLEVLNPTGNKRIVLVVDCLAPRFLEAHPQLAGVDPDGHASEDFASVSALADSAFRTTLLELTQDLAETYAPDEIAFTELMFDDSTFGPNDLAHYSATMDTSQWPTTTHGTLDTTDPSLNQWRSNTIAQFLTSARDAVKNTSTEISIDVRTTPQDPVSGRADSGHDLNVLAPATDRVTIWNYFALNGYPPTQTGQIVEKLEAAHLPTRYTVSIGLWDVDTTDQELVAITASQLRQALDSAQTRAGVSLQVTPASLMTDEHWRVLQNSW